tara:strand:- start:486 stop:1046 length:561 start_codon:yes stop_codon:yes gene_type:complete
MEKEILSQINLYYGQVKMPKGFEIDLKILSDNILQGAIKKLFYNILESDYKNPSNNILQSSFKKTEFLFSKAWDMLCTYIIEYSHVDNKLHIQKRDSWGDMYAPDEKSEILHDIKNHSNYVLLYGVKVDNCHVELFFKDNEDKEKTWNIPLINNKFIMFPSNVKYQIINNQTNNFNIIQTITYDIF